MMLAKVVRQDEEERKRQGRDELERILEKVGLAAEAEPRMRQGQAGEEILEEAQDWDADLIVLGTHGFGFFDRLMFGRTSLYVLRHGHRATLVVPAMGIGE
jgi:nucleotide-binding universal stress UspA family protein